MTSVRSIAFATSLLLASGAYAQSSGDHDRYAFNSDVQQPAPPIEPFANGKTRAEVVQELQLAIATGQIWQGESNQPLPPEHIASDVTRAQVLRELSQARKAGNLSYGELDYPSAS